MAEPTKREELLLIDANSLIHRAYHALPALTSPGSKPAGALYGLASIIIKILKEYSPRYVVAAFDRPEPTFREKVFKEYKATRPPTPSDLIYQIKAARDLLQSFNIHAIEKPGYEADDIIAALTFKFCEQVDQIIIISGDLDILQVVDGQRVVALVPQKGVSEARLYDAPAVKERFGVTPQRMKDYKGLVGDASDNVPGVSGIGPKTAASLINKYGSMENLYKKLKDIEATNPSLANKLNQGRENAFLSKQLVTLLSDLPIDGELNDFAVGDWQRDESLRQYLNSLGFKSLLDRIGKETDRQPRTTKKLF